MRSERKFLQLIIAYAVIDNFGECIENVEEVEVFRPKNDKHADWTSNIAFKLAPRIKRTPKEIVSVLQPFVSKHLNYYMKEVSSQKLAF